MDMENFKQQPSHVAPLKNLKDTLKEAESLSTERIMMPDEYIKYLEIHGKPEYVFAYKKMLDMCRKVKEAGGRALLVGGTVRDHFMGKVPKDFDLEVFGIDPDKLPEVLGSVPGADVKAVGKAFGILFTTFKDETAPEPAKGEKKAKRVSVDVTIPKISSKVDPEDEAASKANVDPFMSIKEACRRRDFTMNSMTADPLTGEVYDPFGGIKDAKERVLRVTDEVRFKDDAVRVLRALQFVGRYGLSVGQESARIIQDTLPLLKEADRTRFTEEWNKLLLKSEQPSYGLIAGQILNVYKEGWPEFNQLIDTPQQAEWHPEGDVWVHTLMVVDAAAAIARRENLSDEDATVLIYAALCHDLGKPTTTKFDEKKGKIVSPAHEQAGKDPTKRFLDGLQLSQTVKDKIINIVGEHIAPYQLYAQFELKTPDDKVGAKSSVRRLAGRIKPASIKLLALLSEADNLGRGPFVMDAKTGEPVSQETINEFHMNKIKNSGGTPAINEVFKFEMPNERAPSLWLLKVNAEIEKETAKLLSGEMLMKHFEVGGGPKLGLIIRLADELRNLGAVNEQGEAYDKPERVLTPELKAMGLEGALAHLTALVEKAKKAKTETAE